MSHKVPNIIRTVNLDSTGEVSKNKFLGTFQVKAILNHADEFAMERMYAKLVVKEEFMKEEQKIRAAVIAELSVRIVNAPDWWNASSNGQTLADKQPLYDLAQLCSEAYLEWSKELDEAVNKNSNSGSVISGEA